MDRSSAHGTFSDDFITRIGFIYTLHNERFYTRVIDSQISAYIPKKFNFKTGDFVELRVKKKEFETFNVNCMNMRLFAHDAKLIECLGDNIQITNFNRKEVALIEVIVTFDGFAIIGKKRFYKYKSKLGPVIDLHNVKKDNSHRVFRVLIKNIKDPTLSNGSIFVLEKVLGILADAPIFSERCTGLITSFNSNEAVIFCTVTKTTIKIVENTESTFYENHVGRWIQFICEEYETDILVRHPKLTKNLLLTKVVDGKVWVSSPATTYFRDDNNSYLYSRLLGVVNCETSECPPFEEQVIISVEMNDNLEWKLLRIEKEEESESEFDISSIQSETVEVNQSFTVAVPSSQVTDAPDETNITLFKSSNFHSDDPKSLVFDETSQITERPKNDKTFLTVSEDTAIEHASVGLSEDNKHDNSKAGVIGRKNRTNFEILNDLSKFLVLSKEARTALKKVDEGLLEEVKDFYFKNN